ncbi:MAG TPA: taurine ABC transporter substrate-binding protein [Steroidobacteraceae bacterium]|nr:taurine ABC transporter substrate-binding protein [Steroidobacteraceae bacterium]
MKRFIKGLLSMSALAVSTLAVAQTKEVTIGYQDMVVPYRVAQEAKELEKATGYKINWKQFGGGGEVIKAMASGAVQIGEVGSAGISAAVSRGEPLELFWILDDIGSAEALVVKKTSGIKTIADLKGKKIAMPFNSTTHFHMMVALEQAKVNPADVQILNMRPPEVRAAWQRGDIDATFIWDPVLAEAKKDGTVILTSGKISADTGKATFDGYIANRDWAKANKDFMVKFVKVLAASDDNYRKNKAKFVKDSAEAKAIAKWSGAKQEDVEASMALYAFPTAQEQATKWLGGKDSIAAKALAATADFQLSQKQIEKKLPDYSIAVNPSYVQEAMK